MSTTTRTIKTRQCDRCRKTEDNPVGWFYPDTHFAFFNGDLGLQNGHVNTAFLSLDFCSLDCAETWWQAMVDWRAKP